MDWIETFLAYTKGIPTPDIFRLWAAIGCLAGAMERRVWIATKGNKLFPNIFIILVGKPASGKTQAIKPSTELWRTVKELHVAPDNTTKAAFMDCLQDAKVVRLVNKQPVEFHSLQVAAPEFGVFMPAHDTDFMATLSDLYDCPASRQEKRRHAKTQIDIIEPQITILGGATPGFLGELLPEIAWTQGFMSRFVLVYSAEELLFDPFDDRETDPALKVHLTLDLKRIHQTYGECKWQPEAQAMMRSWVLDRMPPKPVHSRLQHYNGRRLLHIFKLCMISSISRGNDLQITVPDVQRAQEWLLAAERVMPDVFREMMQSSDRQVMQELHYYAQQEYFRAGRKPIHGSILYDFLTSKVPSQKVTIILDLCVSAGILKCHDNAGGNGMHLYEPRSLYGGAVE